MTEQDISEVEKTVGIAEQVRLVFKLGEEEEEVVSEEVRYLLNDVEQDEAELQTGATLSAQIPAVYSDSDQAYQYKQVQPIHHYIHTLQKGSHNLQFQPAPQAQGRTNYHRRPVAYTIHLHQRG